MAFPKKIKLRHLSIQNNFLMIVYDYFLSIVAIAILSK